MNANTSFDKNTHTDKEKTRAIRAKIHSIYTILGNKIQKKDNIYLIFLIMKMTTKKINWVKIYKI